MPALTRRQTRILLAAAAWTIYVWGFRIVNLVGDDEHGFAFKAVHVALAMVSVAFAVAIGRIGLQARRRRRGREGEPDGDQAQPQEALRR